MPNTQVVFYGANTSTVLTSGGATATIKLNGVTVDTQTVLGVGTTTGSITSNLLLPGNQYTITFSGGGSPSGTMTLFTTPVYTGDNNTNANAGPIYTCLIDGNNLTTTAQVSSILPNPNPIIQTAFITFFNISTGTTLPAGITTTIMVSGTPAAGVVDVQTTNASGQITSTKIFEVPVYTCTFTGVGAPSGTFTMYVNGNNTQTVMVH